MDATQHNYGRTEAGPAARMKKKSTQQTSVGTQPNPETKAEERKRLRKGKYTLQDLRYPDQRVVRFPQVQGKTTEAVELLTSAGYHHITVEFQDKTSLSFAIEPDFTFKAAYEYVKKGKPHAKLWPEIRSRGE
jgi:hypothetical protein